MRDLSIAEQCIPKKCKDDLVSRKQVYKLKLASDNDWEFGQALMDMSSAEPERKKGKWNQIISIPNDMYGRYYCSECGKEGNPLWYFCPCCGADMR